jgi:hypothetical protein
MSMRLAAGALAVSLTVLATPAALARSPTRAEVQAAVRRAERSPKLWATVNICNTRRHPRTIGIRGQMPALGFSASLYMNVTVTYWSFKQKRLVPVPGTNQRIVLGTWARGLLQGGARFAFRPHSGLLSGRITFEWRRRGQQIGRTVRPTTNGHRDADFGDPRHHSSWDCRIR